MQADYLSPAGVKAVAHDITLRSHPFASDAGVIQVAHGQTLLQMLEGLAQGDVRETLCVRVGGYEVPRALWGKVRPKAGAAIHVTAMPQGGDSGDSNKWLRTILMIVVIIAAVYTGGAAAAAYGSMWGAVAQAGVMMIGTLAVNAMVPPPKPKLDMGSQMKGTEGNWNALTGSSNQMAPYGPIPIVVGEARFFPPHAVMPYVENAGTESYQRVMFDLGYGDLDVSDILIGETPLTEFEGVQYEITTTPTLYTNDVFDEALAILLEDGDSDTRNTAPITDEISLDIVFPSGLFGGDPQNGQTFPCNAFFKIEYRLAGTADPWVMPGSTQKLTSTGGMWKTDNATYASYPFVARVDHRKPFAGSFRWQVAQGQYEVRVTRSMSEWGGANPKVGEQCQWVVLRSLRKTNPSTTGTTKLCMRIKASDQLNGTLQTLSCFVKQKIPTRSGGAWTANMLTTNPAWVYAWMLRSCPAFSVHVPDARIDIDAIEDFAAFCDANSFECRGVLDARATARAAIDDVLSNSLGALALRNGKYGVLFDDGTTTPTMAFTPLDSRDFTGSRVFQTLPHALRVKFKNPAANWQQDEIIVLDDGYSYNGKDARGVASALPAPTIFETLELRWAADPIHAWRAGRNWFAQAKFRPTTYSWTTDIANLACTRGDLVHVAHDVPEWGAGWGHVVSLTAGGPSAAVLVVTEEITTDPLKSYSVQFRKNDGSTPASVAVTPHAVETNTFYLASLPTGINQGDAAIIGESVRVTEKLLITGIYPDQDLGARIKAVPFDSRVAPYWADPPVSIVSEVTGQSYREPPDPPVLVVVLSDLLSDDSDDAGITDPTVDFIWKTNPDQYIDPRRDWMY